MVRTADIPINGRIWRRNRRHIQPLQHEAHEIPQKLREIETIQPNRMHPIGGHLSHNRFLTKHELIGLSIDAQSRGQTSFKILLRRRRV